MELYSGPCLVDSKSGYTQYLIRYLKKSYMIHIGELYNDSKLECENYNEDERILLMFQSKLERITRYNQKEKKSLIDSILLNCKCDFLDDLLTAVFILHTKILATIRPKNPPKKIDLVIPNISDFIFQCYVQIARELWKYAYLLQDSEDSITYQKNYNTCEDLVSQCIEDCINDMLPIRNILKDHLEDMNNNIEDFDQENEDENSKTMSELKELKKEILNIKKNTSIKESVVDTPDLNVIANIPEKEIENLDTIPVIEIATDPVKESKSIQFMSPLNQNKNDIKEIEISSTEKNNTVSDSNSLDLDDFNFENVDMYDETKLNDEMKNSFEQC